ncbi:murein biosynthesis integral membrane protein MurJ [Paraoerskovia marina]|uniref:murein biosynthesis integral membrane protein MurJ n=1 Tax=Paraoerskovia marina TaxID=545619 RepID=UPI000AC3343B|nr:murein biosynthesis integral membrane protein MurJ [Paraoerskovia marina]
MRHGRRRGTPRPPAPKTIPATAPPGTQPTSSDLTEPDTAGGDVTPDDVTPDDVAPQGGATGGGETGRGETGGGGSSLGRSSAVMAAGTAVSRGLGLVRNMLLVGAVGATGLAADAFDVANKIPNIFFAILAGGVLNAVLVPQIVRAYTQRNPEERIGKLLTLAMTFILAITVLLTLGSSIIIPLYAGDSWSDPQLALAITFGYWCIPQLMFYGLYTLLGQVLNARRQFGPFMWAPVVNNLVSIAGFAVFIAIYGPAATGQVDDLSAWDGPKIALLAGTATAGIALQALVLFVPLYRGGFRWRVAFGFRGIGLRSAGQVAGWTFGAVLLEQLGVLMITRIAAAAPGTALSQGFGPFADAAGSSALITGVVAASPEAYVVAGPAAYSQALMIYLLPHSLVTVSIATALFTGMSAAANARDTAAVRADLSRGLRVIAVFTIFATAVLIVLAHPVTKLLVPTGSPASIVAISQVLVAMSIGLFPLGGMVLMKWVYYAYEDGRSVFLIQFLGTVLLLAAAYGATAVLDARWWVVGIAGAMSLSNILVIILRAAGLRKRLDGLDGARVLRLLVRVLVASLVASGAGWLALQPFGDLYGLSWTRALLVAGCAGLVMLAVYLLLLRIMHVRELDDLARPLMAKIRPGR